ncbi:MAG: hypothetical protein KGZ71_07235, partial [Desulfobulbaceae bacterium]|nr:hypothetical protein [Desulfobulbaceae bacterium]
MKRAFLFLVTVAMLLIDTSPLWTQGEPISLQEIWRREENGMTFERVCKPGRIVKMGLIKD